MKIKVIHEDEEYTQLYMIKDNEGLKHLMHPYGIMKGLGIWETSN